MFAPAFSTSPMRIKDKATVPAPTDEDLAPVRGTDLGALDAVTAGITIQDERGRLVYGNQAAAELVGMPSVEALLRATPGELVARFEVLDADGRPLPPGELPG